MGLESDMPPVSDLFPLALLRVGGSSWGSQTGPPGWACWFAQAWGWDRTPYPWALALLLSVSPFLALGVMLPPPRGDRGVPVPEVAC